MRIWQLEERVLVKLSIIVYQHITLLVDIRDGISAGKKFRISDDLFRIHLGRASISAKFRLILHQFRIIQVNRLAGLSRSSIEWLINWLRGQSSSRLTSLLDVSSFSCFLGPFLGKNSLRSEFSTQKRANFVLYEACNFVLFRIGVKQNFVSAKNFRIPVSDG